MCPPSRAERLRYRAIEEPCELQIRERYRSGERNAPEFLPHNRFCYSTAERDPALATTFNGFRQRPSVESRVVVTPREL